MARTYKRDSNGRFASTGGARSGRPAARPVSRGKNRITRDNAGRMTSVGGEGATARGGRLRTAAGNKRAVQTARIKGGGGRLRKPVGGGGKPAWAPTANAKGQVTGIRNRNAATPSRDAVARAARQGRAVRNLNAAMKRESDGPDSKASRSASVAKRASAIYNGKVDPRSKTKARLTKTQDPEVLRRRMKKMKDNTIAKPATKPGKPVKRKPKSAEDLISQMNRIDARARRMSYAARTGFRARQVEARAERAVKAAKSRAIDLSKPKPESKTAKAKRERVERARYREQLINANRLVMEARRRR